jgi:hypothetical protein
MDAAMVRRPVHDGQVSQMKKMAVILSVLAVAGLASGVSAHRRELLASFDGGIGVIPVSSFAAPINQDGTFQNVVRNFVKGVRSSTQLWRIADLRADVTTDGRIKVRGRGLLLAGGDLVGTTANLSVVATLICEATAPFVEFSTADTTDGIVWSGGVKLDAGGDFRIDETLRGRSGAAFVRSDCAAPTLLIRSSGNGAWLAAGIPRVDEDN